MSTLPALHQRLAQAFQVACLAELETIKPGNVHLFADGHGMVLQDFVRSAEAAAGVIAAPGLAVGERIFNAVEATSAAVGCNTNLGIVLLCAPLIHAVLSDDAPDLRQRLRNVLQQLTVEDAAQAFRAILLAAPAGLGESPRHDVHAPPTVTLQQAMAEAAGRDRLAWQYAHDFEDVFEFGMPRFAQLLQRWERPAWAATGVYLGYLARFPDSHVLRKYGAQVADQIRQEAMQHEQAFLAQENPKLYQRALLDYDASLKSRGINPGTSADLTVATLLVPALEKMVTEFAAS